MTKPIIGVLGAGAWGTALAIHLAKLHPQIHLWARNTNALQEIIADKENKRYLPGASLPENIIPSTDFATLINSCTHVIVAVPSTTMRDMMQRINAHASDNLRGIIWACKGLEQNTGKFLHQVAEEELAEKIHTAILSGPSFAQEVGQGLPTAVTIASTSEAFANEVAQLFHHPLFRTYISTDVTGVEIGGTFKNILAIAAGIIDGLQFGANARAALITRGVAEMTRFGKRLEVNTDTFSGLSGIGDIVLTCTENMSRNRRFGLGLGAGKSLQDVEQDIGQVIEGKYAAKVVFELAQKLDIELPISQQVYEVLYNNKPAREAVEDLLARSLKNEAD
ncbi:MAG: NAD(P)H-dependent glycerol-3-phosphate dehydrogenase [Gammaproteobacteria bacterium]